MAVIAIPEPVELRSIWNHESDFTNWLADNIYVLNDLLGLDLIVSEKEKAVGTFSADIVAQDSSGRLAIIENQLEMTNHDHLGKILTYLSNLQAKIAIWISSDPRQEHKEAIDYLNEIAPATTQFFLLKVQAFGLDSRVSLSSFCLLWLLAIMSILTYLNGYCIVDYFNFCFCPLWKD